MLIRSRATDNARTKWMAKHRIHAFRSLRLQKLSVRLTGLDTQSKNWIELTMPCDAL